MAVPFLAALAPRVRRLLPIIKAGVYRGVPSRSINAAIKAVEGKGLNRQVLLDVMRALSGIERAGKHLRNLGRNAVPNIKRLPVSLHKIRTPLSFLVKTITEEMDTGLQIISWVRVGISEAISRTGIEKLAQARIEKRRQQSKLIFISAQLQEGIRAPEIGLI